MPDLGTSNIDCHGIAIPSVDETALPCNGGIITTDCITSTRAYNVFGTGVGEYLTVILTRISEKVRFINNLLNLKANIASPTLTGIPAAPTAPPGTNSTQIATTEYVNSALLENLQKTITYPADFTGINYTLTNADNGYSIIVSNSSTAVTITVPSGLTSKFQVGIIQEGTGDITITPSSTTLRNAISGYKIKGQYDQVYLEQDLATSVYYLLGNTRV